MSATYTGKNVDAALQKASEATGIPVDALNYEVLAGQTGGFALVRVLGKRVAVPMEEKLSGDPNAEGGESRPRREPRGDRPERRDDRPERREGRGGGDRGGDRREGRGGGDRGGRGDRRDDRGGRGDRRDDRGGRGDRGDRREGREEFWPSVPTDGPEAVTVAFEGDISDEGREYAALLQNILERMGFGLELHVSENDSQVVIDLRSEVYATLLEARDLELVQSLEHLVEKALSDDEDRSRKKLSLDVNGEKARAEVELATTAKMFAEKAIAQQKIFKLGPLDPRARRIVHLTLKTYPGVITRSEGEGLFRRVGIIPEALAAAAEGDSEG
jgi:spoIIIJ-associated protein